MDTGGDSNHNGNGHADPSNRSDQSSQAVPPGAPAPGTPSAPEAVAPVEPLVVIDKDPPKEKKPSRSTLRLMKLFLAALRKTGNITLSAEKSGISKQTHYNWLEWFPSYRPEFESAYVNGANETADRLEDRLDRAAMAEGLGFNVTAAIFRLKALRPHIYRERYEVTGAGGSPLNPAKVEHTIKYDFSGMNEDEVNDLYTKLRRSRVLPPTGN